MDKWIGIQTTTEKWTSGMRGQVLFTNLDPTGSGGKKRERERKREKEREFRDRGSTFSLDFPVIGSSNFGETRGKVDPHCKSYALVPVLLSFDNSGR